MTMQAFVCTTLAVMLCLLQMACGNGVVFVGQVNTVPPMKSVYLMKVRVNDDSIAVDTITDAGNGLGFQANGKPHIYIAGTTDVNIESIEDNIEVNSHDRTRYDSRFIRIIGEDGVDFSANNAGTPDGADGGDVTISAAVDVIASAGTDVAITAEENVYVNAMQNINLTARDRDAQILAGLDVDINAHGFVYFNASTGNIEIQADFRDVHVVSQENILLKTEVEDIQFCATLRDANFIAKEAHRWCAKEGGISIFTGRELGGFDPVQTPTAQDGIRIVSASPGGGTVISSATRASGDTLNVPAPSENGIIVHAARENANEGGVIVYTEDATAHNQPTGLGGSVQFMAYQTDGGIDLRTGATHNNADAQDNNIVFHASEGNVLFSSASNRNMPRIDDAGQHVMFHASPEDDGSNGGSVNFWTSTTDHDLLTDAKVAKIGNVLFNMREGNGYLLLGVGTATAPPSPGVFDNHIIIHADGETASTSNIFIGTGASNIQDPVMPEGDGVIFRAANPEGGVVVASQSDIPEANPDGITFNAHFFENGGGENELASDRGGILLAAGPIPSLPNELTGDLDMNILVNTRGDSQGGIMIATGFLNDYTVKDKDIISLSLAETGGQVFQSSATSDPVRAQDYSIIFQSGGPQNSAVGSILITSGRNDEIPIPNGENPADNSIIILTDAAATSPPGPVGGMYIATGYLDTVPIGIGQGDGAKNLVVNAFAKMSSQDRDSVGGVAWATGNCHVDVATDNDVSFVAENADSGMTVSIGDSGPQDISVVVQTGSHLTLVPETVQGGIVLNTGDLRETKDDISPNDIFLRAAGGGGVCLGTGNTFSVNCATSNDIALNAAVREFGNNAISPSSIPSVVVATGSAYGVRQTGQIIFNTVQSGGTEGSILLYTNDESVGNFVDATNSDQDIYVGARSDGMVLIGTGDFTQFKGSQNDVYLAATQENGGVLLNVGVALPVQEGNLIANAFNDLDGDNNPTGSIGIFAGFQSTDLQSSVGGENSADIVVDVFNPDNKNGQLTFATGPFNPRATVGYDLIHIHAGSTYDNDAGGILVYAGDTVRDSTSAVQLSKATPFDVQISVPGSANGGITLATINSDVAPNTKAITPADDLLRIQSMEQSTGGITAGTGVIEEPAESSITIQAQIGGMYVVAAGTPELSRPSANDIQIQSPSNQGGVIITSADVATTPAMAFIPDVANAIQVVAPGGTQSGILYHTGSQTTVPVQENDIYLLSGEGDVNLTVETVDGIILFDALNIENTQGNPGDTHGIVALNSDLVEWNTSTDITVVAETTNVKVEAGSNVSLWALKSAQFIAQNDDVSLVAPVGGLWFGATDVAGAPDDGDVNFSADGDLFVEAGDSVALTSIGGHVLGRASHGIQIGAGVAPSHTGLVTVGSTFIDASDRVSILAASAFELSVRGTSPLFPVQRTVTSDSQVTQPGFISVAAVSGANDQAAIEIAASTTIIPEKTKSETNGNIALRADASVQYHAVDDVSFEVLDGANNDNGIQVISRGAQYVGASNALPPSRPQGTIDLMADGNMDILAGQRVTFMATDDVGVRAEMGGVQLMASPQNHPAPLRDQVQLISDKKTTLHAINNLQLDSQFGDISFTAHDGAIQVLSDSLQTECQSVANIDGRINFRACGSETILGQAFQYSRATEGNPGISNTAEGYLQVYGGQDGVLLEAVPAETELKGLDSNKKTIKILASEVINGAAVDSLTVKAESVEVLAENGGSISIFSSSQPHAIPDSSNIFVIADKAVEFRADFSNTDSELTLQTQGVPIAPIVFGTKRGVTQILSSITDRSTPSPSNIGDLHLQSLAGDVNLLARNDVTFTSTGPASFTGTGLFTFTTSIDGCSAEPFTTTAAGDVPGPSPAQSCSLFQMDAGGRTEIRAAHGQAVDLTVAQAGFAFVASSSGDTGNVIIRGGSDVILSVLAKDGLKSSDVLISATDGGIWDIATDTTNLDLGLEVTKDTVFHAGVSIADAATTALTTGTSGGAVDPTTFNRLGSLGKLAACGWTGL